MPRKRIDFQILDTPYGDLRYRMEEAINVPLFVAVDVARALGYPHKWAAATTNAWAAYGQLVNIVPGRKDWRMLTIAGIRQVCEHSHKPRAEGFASNIAAMMEPPK
jgi:prophage antirepressor-like protein